MYRRNHIHGTAEHQETEDQQGANLGFEATLWAAADKLRGHMDAAEYKHVVLGLIFLKYISDACVKRQCGVNSQTITCKFFRNFQIFLTLIINY